MRVGFDFDGTLASPRRGTAPNYRDPEAAVLEAAAMVGPVMWMRQLLRGGHEALIVTGRSEADTPWI